MDNSVIGSDAARIEGAAKVTGQALYPGDISYPDALHMATLFAGRVHARVVSIDTSAAERAPGVVAVFTAGDVPVNEYGLQIQDQPVLCGPGSAKAGADIVRFVGDQLALVVAETESQARAALPLIRVEWEELPAILTPEEAMRPGAAPLHPHCPDNVAYSYHIRKGDIEAGFLEADVIIESVYETPVQEHAYLQPEAGVAYFDEEGRVTVAVAGQWAHVDRKEIAHSLDIPVDQVRVIYPAIGGAFGGREDMSVQITLALAVWRLAQRGIRRPVKTLWTPRGIDGRPRQATCDEAEHPLGGQAKRQIDRGRGEGDRRRRRLHVHEQQGAGQHHPHVRRALRNPERQDRHLRRLHQPGARRCVPRLRRTARALRRREPDGQAGRSARDRPGRDEAEERPDRGEPVDYRHPHPGRGRSHGDHRPRRAGGGLDAGRPRALATSRWPGRRQGQAPGRRFRVRVQERGFQLRLPGELLRPGRALGLGGHPGRNRLLLPAPTSGRDTTP